MKRKFTDFCKETEKDSNAPSNKRQRIDINMKSSYFENQSDQEQFLEIFKSVENSEIIQALCISHDINKSIAEYATGKWMKCECSNNCGEIVSVLHGKEEYDCPNCTESVKRSQCRSCNGYEISYGQLICDDPYHGEDYICEHCFERCDVCEAQNCKLCMKHCKICKLAYCQECDECQRLILGDCAICGETVCGECISMTRLSCISQHIEDCVCSDCFKIHKDIFKHKN